MRGCRSPRAAPAPGGASSITARTASAVDGAATSAAPGSCSARNRAHCPSACGCECDRADLVGRDLLGGDQRVAHRGGRPRRRSRRRARSNDERVERRVDAALARVLERDEPELGLAAPAPRGRRPGPSGTRRARRRRRRREQRVVRVGPRRTEVGGAHQSSRATEPRSPASARRMASSSSGESRCSPRPSTHLLAVQPRGVAVGDRGEHDAVALRVEQRERRGLVARTARRRRRSGRARGT